MFLFLDAPDLVMDISTFSESIKVESHPLYQLRCSFEENCLAPIVDRLYYQNHYLERHLLKFTSRFLNKGSVSFRPFLDKTSWQWHQCHKHYHSSEVFAVYDLIGKRVSYDCFYQHMTFTIICISWEIAIKLT